MSSKAFKIIILFLALWLGSTAENAVAASWKTWLTTCTQALESVFTSSSITKSLSNEEAEQLLAWNKQNELRYSNAIGFTIHPDLFTAIYRTLAELPDGMRRSLFVADGKPLTRKQLRKRLESLGVDIDQHIIFSYLLFRHYRNGVEDPYADIVETINRYKLAGLDEVQKSRRKLRDAIYLTELESLLRNNHTREYVLHVGEGVIQMPDGRKYLIHRKKRSGKIVVAVPSDRVIGESSGVDLRNFQPMSTVIKGSFLPDGRFFTQSIQDLSRARIFAKNGFNLVTIEPHTDDRFYSLSHYELAVFYKAGFLRDYVESLTPQEKTDFMIRAENSPFEVMDELYHQSMQGVPPFN